MPCFLKMPVSMPTSTGTNWKVAGLRLADPDLGLGLRGRDAHMDASASTEAARRRGRSQIVTFISSGRLVTGDCAAY